MTVGYGEYSVRDRFNKKWKENGFCFRVAQRRGDPAAISDLIAGINGKRTYSIEVKKISNQVLYGKVTNRPFEFKRNFSVSKRKIEFPHQLERQVRISQRMGWVPLLLLQVVTDGETRHDYLFSSEELLRIMKSGKLSISAKAFPELHNEALYNYLFKVNKDSGRKADIGCDDP